MRIEAYNQVQQVYQSRPLNKTQKTNSAGRADELQISTFGKDIQIAKAALADCPDIREELTSSVRAELQNGTYSVDSAALAEKLLYKYEEMR